MNNYWGVAKADCLSFKKKLFIFLLGSIQQLSAKNAYFSVFFLWDRSSRSGMGQILHKDRYSSYMDIKTNYFNKTQI